MTHAVIITTGRKSRDEQLQFSLNGTEVRVMEAEGGKKTWRIFLGDGVNACNAEGKKKGGSKHLCFTQTEQLVAQSPQWGNTTLEHSQRLHPFLFIFL